MHWRVLPSPWNHAHSEFSERAKERESPPSQIWPVPIHAIGFRAVLLPGYALKCSQNSPSIARVPIETGSSFPDFALRGAVVCVARSGAAKGVRASHPFRDTPCRNLPGMIAIVALRFMAAVQRFSNASLRRAAGGAIAAEPPWSLRWAADRAGTRPRPKSARLLNEVAPSTGRSHSRRSDLRRAAQSCGNTWRACVREQRRRKKSGAFEQFTQRSTWRAWLRREAW